MIKPEKNLGDIFISSNVLQVRDQYRKVIADLGLGFSQVVRFRPMGNGRLVLTDKWRKEIRNCEGIISGQNNLFFSMLTADCMPLVIFDPKNNAYAFVHVGWRAITNNIILRSIKKLQKYFGSRPGDLVVYGGPGISKDAYQQVGFYAVIKSLFFKLSGNKNFTGGSDGKIFFDIKNATIMQLKSAGVSEDNIEISKICTVLADPQLPSHLRDGKKRKSSLLTVVGLPLSRKI